MTDTMRQSENKIELNVRVCKKKTKKRSAHGNDDGDDVVTILQPI